ncbi:uncharacterized protein LOC122093963 [Macadamia integrifolia]|uniref:uncharacterized protein LOC122093963 n=1 Tax=Macadamia integrifolia TaxID=60698 RepID=UPI001C4E50A0|nr:uncharacterized protein LOC122093963 [Macadamia integrifolia]
MDPSSSSWTSQSVTTEELRWFHSIDSEIFRRLVLSLGRGVEETMKIIGLWLWLESMGFPNMVVRLLSLPDIVLNLITNEAVNCLNALERGASANTNTNNDEQLLFTRRILNSTVISLSFLNENRISAIRSITKFLTDVGNRVFDDIIQKTINHRNQLFNSIFGGEGGGVINSNLRPTAPTFFPGLNVRGKQVMVGLCMGLDHSQSGFQVPFPSNSQFVVGAPSSSSTTPPALLPQYPPPVAAADTTENSADERTLFITFSRGYPINETELRVFFAMNYGDCVESIYMQEVQQPYVQALFARVVINSSMIMDAILQEEDSEGKAKFVINGKHAWARKYFPKESNN